MMMMLGVSVAIKLDMPRFGSSDEMDNLDIVSIPKISMFKFWSTKYVQVGLTV